MPSTQISLPFFLLALLLAGCTPDPGPSDDDDAADDDDATSEVVTFTRHTVDAGAEGAAFTSVADLNGDGLLDIVASKFGALGFSIPDGTVSVYTQGADLASWTTEDVVAPAHGIKFPNHTTLHDLDADGDLDIVLPYGFLVCTAIPLGGPCGGLAWFENDATGWIQHDVVANGNSLFFHGAAVVDFDDDGRLDLVTTAEEQGGFLGSDQALLRYYAGVDTPDLFDSTPHELAAGGGSFPTVADLDNDGDLDVASAEFFVDGGSFAWFERTTDTGATPAGTFVRHVIDDDAGPSIQLQLVDDFFGDGQQIALGSNHSNTSATPADPWESGLYAYEPGANLTQPWTRSLLSDGIVSGPGSLFAPQAAPGVFDSGDVDGDGDLDVVISGDGDPNVYWIEQVSPTDFVTHILEANLAQAGGLVIADLNGDGTNEIVVTGYEANVVYVFERD